jgi:hypothetical protein
MRDAYTTEERQQTTTGQVLPHRAAGARCRRFAVAMLIAIMAAPGGRVVAQTCVGDCNGDGSVEINELILGVNIALGVPQHFPVSNLDDWTGMVTVDRLIAAVNSALCGCGGACPTPALGSPTPTATGGTATPSTPTPNRDGRAGDAERDAHR